MRGQQVREHGGVWCVVGGGHRVVVVKAPAVRQPTTLDLLVWPGLHRSIVVHMRPERKPPDDTVAGAREEVDRQWVVGRGARAVCQGGAAHTLTLSQ